MDSQYKLAATFMRFQEFYESPKFKGQDFSVEEFMDWYAEQHGGRFTYFDDWHCFNVPHQVFDIFRRSNNDLGANSEFKKLAQWSCKERRLMDSLRHRAWPYYVIGLTERRATVGGDIKHEFIHGVCHINIVFKMEATKIISKYGLIPVFDIFRKWGYDESVRGDETIAYFMTGLVEELVPLGPEYEEMTRELHNLFKQMFGFSLRRASAQRIKEEVNIISL
jgi:hypothetical protein